MMHRVEDWALVLAALLVSVFVAVGVTVLTRKVPLECPPQWKCNGTAQTNDSRCCP